MKQLQETTAIKILLALFTVSAFAAGPVMRVAELKGNAFLVKESGSTFKLQKDYHIEDMSQVLVDESSQLTMVDYNENTYHLSAATQVKVVGEDVHLTHGSMWVEATSKPNFEGYNVLSPNGVVNFKTGNFIYSYSNVDGKSQVFVIKGEVDFYNRFQKHFKYSVESGKFSFIENKYEEGHPRVPTNLGFKSFKKVTSLFNGVKIKFRDEQKTEVANTKVIRRNIASTKPAPVVNLAANAGGVLFISSKTVSRSPNSLDKKSIKKYIPKKKVSAYKKASVNYYGYNAVAPKKVVPVKPKKAVVKSKFVFQPTQRAAKRKPSSIKPMSMTKKIAPKKNRFDNMFEKSLKKNYNQQKKHPAELNDLIDELDSYSNDFKKTYY